jgi:hypothetical protein
MNASISASKMRRTMMNHRRHRGRGCGACKGGAVQDRFLILLE